MVQVKKAIQPDSRRFVVKPPPYTKEKLDALFEATGMTAVQLFVIMVDKLYASLIEEKAA